MRVVCSFQWTTPKTVLLQAKTIVFVLNESLPIESREAVFSPKPEVDIR